MPGPTCWPTTSCASGRAGRSWPGRASALPHARRALELHKALVERCPDAVPLERDLAAVYLLVGWLLHTDNRSDEALAYLRPCLELRRRILATDSNNVDFHSELAG